MKKALFISFILFNIIFSTVLFAQEIAETGTPDTPTATDGEDATTPESGMDFAPGDVPVPVEITMKEVTGGELDYMGHTPVTVDAFQISVYEFTNRQAVTILNWALLEGKISPQLSNKSQMFYKGRPYLRISTPDCALFIPGMALLDVRWMEDNQPLVYITPLGAMILCNLLSDKEGLTPCYDLDKLTWDQTADGYRLPTSAELEWANRQGDDGLIPAASSPGKRTPDEHCWHLGNRFTYGKSLITSIGSHLVGTRKPNGLGLYDTAGNVSEICWDRYSYGWHPDENAKNPDGAEIKEDELDSRVATYFVTRGGSWNLPASRLKTGAKGFIPVDKYSSGIGFRLVKGAR